jgi:putative transposase
VDAIAKSSVTRRVGDRRSNDEMKFPAQSKREYLRQLTEEKARLSRPLTAEEKKLGFPGWHQRGYLPHCDYQGLTQFVTFRLADSMPVSRRSEWEHLLKIEDSRTKRKELEQYLDRGLGACHLRNAGLARIVEDALMHFHGNRMELLAWCVMPNHVHVLARIWQTPLYKLVRSWKRFVTTSDASLMERRPPARREGMKPKDAPARRSAFRVQRLRWQRDYWDTFMRDEEQERTAIRYIENNPVKARLCPSPEEWPCGSARFRDKYRRLTIARPYNNEERHLA